MSLAVVKDGIVLPIKVTHWWPGRSWRGPCPIPRSIIKQTRGSKYLTVAKVELEPGFTMFAFARCNPVDVPSRAMGRTIAVGRLRKMLEHEGYILEE